jgi:hypothetical protein
MKKFLLTAALLGLAMPASAATLTSLPNACGKGCTVIRLEGKIELGDDDKFKRLVTKQKIADATIELNSPGGYVYPAMMIGATVRDSGFSTYVPPKTDCASACATIWLAGATRFVAKDASIGFHGAGKKGRNGKTVAMPEFDKFIAQYYKLLGLNQTAIDFLQALGPEDMTWMSGDKAEELGIKFEIFPNPEEKKTEEKKPDEGLSNLLSPKPLAGPTVEAAKKPMTKCKVYSNDRCQEFEILTQ